MWETPQSLNTAREAWNLWADSEKLNQLLDDVHQASEHALHGKLPPALQDIVDWLYTELWSPLDVFSVVQLFEQALRDEQLDASTKSLVQKILGTNWYWLTLSKPDKEKLLVALLGWLPDTWLNDPARLLDEVRASNNLD